MLDIIIEERKFVNIKFGKSVHIPPEGIGINSMALNGRHMKSGDMTKGVYFEFEEDVIVKPGDVIELSATITFA